jgi:MFS family permease
MLCYELVLSRDFFFFFDYLPHRFGRKIGIITLAAISLVFAPILAITPNLATLIIARGILGIGVGMAAVVCPMYLFFPLFVLPFRTIPISRVNRKTC